LPRLPETLDEQHRDFEIHIRFDRPLSIQLTHSDVSWQETPEKGGMSESVKAREFGTHFSYYGESPGRLPANERSTLQIRFVTTALAVIMPEKRTKNYLANENRGSDVV